MAKELPKYEDWKAPWEEKNETFDSDSARKLIYNALSQSEKAKEGQKEAREQLASVTTERDEARTRVTELEDSGLSETDKLKRENERLRTAQQSGSASGAAQSGPTEDQIRSWQMEVAVDKGLSKSDALRLRGKTLDELADDADVFLTEHPVGGGAGGEGDGKGGSDGASTKTGKGGPPGQRPASTMRRLSGSNDDDLIGEYVDPKDAMAELPPRH